MNLLNHVFKLLLGIALCLCPRMLLAETYYVNSNWGDDTYSGKTKDQPWKGFSNLEKNTFYPGDSILFAKGSKYKGGFVFKSSGTKEKPIVFSNYSVGADVIKSTNRKELENIFKKYGAGNPPAFSNPDWNLLNGNIFQIHASHIVINGLYFHDNTNPPNHTKENKNVQKLGAVYLALGADHNKVINCEFVNTPVAIKIKGSHNLVSHNYFHDTTTSMAATWGPIAIMIVKPYNEISYNRITNYGSYGGPYGSDGGVIELDGVDVDFEGSHINIHHNISINNHGFLEMAARNSDSITVAYNLSDDKNQFIGGGGMHHLLVINNTVIRKREPNVDRHVFWTFYPENNSITVRNNIFVLPGDMKVFGPFVKQEGHHRSLIGNQPHDHNLYYSVGNSDPVGVPLGEGDRIADPLFIDFKNGNYRLTKDSPAIDAGIETQYHQDLDGYSVPRNNRVDIGAFEF